MPRSLALTTVCLLLAVAASRADGLVYAPVPPSTSVTILGVSAIAQPPKKEEPTTEKPKKEEPKKEAPKKEEPKKVEPKKEEPKKVEPKKEEPKKEEPKKEAPKKVEPKKEEPKKEAPKKVEPKKEEPKKTENRKGEDCCGKGDCETDIKDTTLELKVAEDKDCDKKVEKKPIKSEPKGDFTVIEESQKFYGVCVDFQGTVKIPQQVNLQVEKVRFEKKTYKVGCCEYKVCVPVETCLISCKKCELRDSKVKMQACVRTCDDTVDVYVLDVPGMPPKWALSLGMSKEEVEKLYKIELDKK